jgi:hypothetical protein
MGPYLQKLLSLSSPPLSAQNASLDMSLRTFAGALADELSEVLGAKNGFYAFESALHVFPAGETESGISLSDWNSFGLWKSHYGEDLTSVIFFAEDIFGEQFAIKDSGVFRFDPETYEFSYISESLELWAREILEDYENQTGYTAAQSWKNIHGPIPPGYRLIPKMPFILDGSFEIDNLRVEDPISAMHFRAELANKIRNLPDGATIEIHITD